MSSWIETELLPITDEFRRQKRLIQPRGELALIEDGESFEHLGYFSLLAGQGYRGGHYHQRKTERFYVISGRLRIELCQVAGGERDTVEVQAGTKVAIPPGIAHRFEALEDAQVIEYYAGTFDPDDDYPFTFTDG